MLSPKFGLMSYAEKKYPARKACSWPLTLNGELGIGSKSVVPNSLVTVVTL